MKNTLRRGSWVGGLLLTAILLFALIDFATHRLSTAWSVPEYYFRNKILFGFFWSIIGWLLARKVKTVWLKALTVAGVIAATLQIRYFLEGYALNFVVLFLFLHFIMLYGVFVLVFLVDRKWGKTNKKYLD